MPAPDDLSDDELLDAALGLAAAANVAADETADPELRDLAEHVYDSTRDHLGR